MTKVVSIAYTNYQIYSIYQNRFYKINFGHNLLDLLKIEVKNIIKAGGLIVSPRMCVILQILQLLQTYYLQSWNLRIRSLQNLKDVLYR